MHRTIATALIVLHLPGMRCQLFSQDPPLRLDQVEQLIPVVPDSAVAIGIRRRHVAFPVCARTIESLRRAGAGRETLKALAALKVDTTLTILTQPAEPDCEVIVDGSGLYRTDALGRLVVECLEPGEHQVVVRKLPRYAETQERVDLSHGPKTIPVTLKPAKGSISISVLPSVPGTTIAIGDVKHSGSDKTLELESGVYTVTVSAPCYATSSLQARVPSADTVKLPVKLVVDRNCFFELVADMNRACREKSYELVAPKALGVLSLEPMNLDALRCIAQAYYRTDQFENFVKFAQRTLEAGESIELPAFHLHSRIAGGTHPETLIISTDTIRFDPKGSHPTDIVLLRRVNAINVTTNTQNEVVLTLRNPGRDRWDFADWKSQIDERAIKRSTIVPRKDAAASLTAIQNILDYARRTR